ncbi:MAG: 1-acyl-sn-glycerol-3-phosphate acyltransferase [Bacteroidia bacterium]
MLKKVAKWLFEDVWGWKVEGELPTIKKFLIVVAPHTSNWDFLVGVLFRKFTDGFDPKYIAKKELFVWPIGFIFRGLGGYPVERSKNTNLVDSIVEVYNTNEEFCTTITPEGTRSYSPKWKTGFYHIAKKANVPIMRVAFDFSTKTVIIDKPYLITKDVEETVIEFKKYFSKYKGKNPEDGVKWPE